jgi:hypothetical protein
VSDIATFLSKWGAPILQLIVDGLQQGLTLSFINEILDTLGPLFLKQAIRARRQQNIKLRSSVLTADKQAAAEEAPEATHACCDDFHVFSYRLGQATQQGGIIQGEPDNTIPIPSISGSVLIEVIKQYLPALIRQYGPAILEWLANEITIILSNSSDAQKFAAQLDRIAMEAHAE